MFSQESNLIPLHIILRSVKDAEPILGKPSTQAAKRRKGFPFFKLPGGIFYDDADLQTELLSKKRQSTAQLTDQERGRRFDHLPKAREKALAARKAEAEARRITAGGAA